MKNATARVYALLILGGTMAFLSSTAATAAALCGPTWCP